MPAFLSSFFPSVAAQQKAASTSDARSPYVSLENDDFSLSTGREKYERKSERADARERREIGTCDCSRGGASRVREEAGRCTVRNHPRNQKLKKMQTSCSPPLFSPTSEQTKTQCKFDSPVLQLFTSSLFLAGLVSSLVASGVTRK